MNKVLPLYISTILLLTLCTLKAGAEVFTVCATGCNYTKIQDAIDASENGDTVLIGEGKYKENLNNSSEKQITLQGAGANNTVIDGGRIDRVISVADELTISDVTLTGGKASGGGALQALNVGFTIRNCVLKNNHAGSGGAILTGDGTFRVINIIFIDNRSELDGGAIKITSVGATLILENSIVMKNNAGKNGGGIAITELTDMQMTNSLVSNNRARQNGGGVYFELAWPSKIEDSVISENRAIRGSGGGIYVSLLDDFEPELELKNTFIKENRANLKGGGIFSTTEEPGIPVIEIHEGKIVGNRARLGGGIYNDEFYELFIDDSHIIKNRANTGGGILNKGVITIDRSNVVFNRRDNCVGCE